MSDAPLPLNSEKAPPLTAVQWLICAMTAIGFDFDMYVLLMLPLIIKPALQALGGANFTPGSPAYVEWARLLFFVPAIVGGGFGLLGGYLTDLLGRRRVLTASILLYAVSTLASGDAVDLKWLLILRCGGFAGVWVEFVGAGGGLGGRVPNTERGGRGAGAR